MYSIENTIALQEIETYVFIGCSVNGKISVICNSFNRSNEEVKENNDNLFS